MTPHPYRSSNRSRPLLSIRAALGVTLLLGAALPVASAEDAKPAAPLEFYKVQLVHPAKVGDQFHMRREIERSATEATETNGKPQASKSSEVQINFYGTLEVLAANKQGHADKFKVSAGVASVRRPGSSGHEMLLKPGTEFTLTFAGGKATVADYEAQHPLSEDAKTFLPIVFEATGAKGDASLAEILDTASASKGTNWNIDAKAAAAELHNFDPKLKPSDVSGTARIKSVVGEGEKKVLMVEYEFTANSKKPANPPAGMTPVSATRVESGTLTMPANLATGYFNDKALIRTTRMYKKTVTKKVSTKVGGKTVTKNEKFNEQTLIEESDKISTLLRYDSGASAGKTEAPSPSTSKPSPSPSPSSASASTGQ